MHLCIPSVSFIDSLFFFWAKHRHIPQLPLAALKDVPNLKTATLTKLSSEIDRHYNLLAMSLASLEEAAAALTAAVAPLSELALQEENDSLLHGSPVFTSLSLYIITGMFEKIETRYLAELERKQAVVEDFEISAIEAQKLASNKESKASIECSEGFLQVHITAWMLSPEVEDAAVQSDITLIKQDAASC